MSWPNVRLGDVVAVMPSASTSTDGETAVTTVTSGCLTPVGFTAGGVRTNRMSAEAAVKGRIALGEVLVSRSNTGELVGRAAWYPGEPDGLVASDLVFRLRPQATISPEYLGRYLAALQLEGYWRSRSSGASSTMKKIKRSQLEALIIPLPPIDEQHRIAARLTEQLAAVEQAQAAAAAQRRLVASLWAQAYELGFRSLVPLSVSAPTPRAPSGWRWSLLTDLARLESGHTPSRNHPEWWGGEIPWLALPDIRAVDGCVIYSTSEYTNAEGIAHSAARVLPEGTVALSRTASVGFVTIFGRPMATSQDFVNWVCGPELDPRFLMHLLIRSRDAIRSLSSGAVHKTVYYPTVKQFRICVPPIAEQRRLVDALDAQLAVVDQCKQTVEAQMGAADGLPAALLRDAFADDRT